MGTENPAHYKSHPSGVECIQIIYPLYYGQGNAIKYLWRLGMKDEDLAELKKAMWYAEHSLEAGMEVKSYLYPFDSILAFEQWEAAEPEGYRKAAIKSLYVGNYNYAIDAISAWYYDIAGELMPAFEVPAVNTNLESKLAKLEMSIEPKSKDWVADFSGGTEPGKEHIAE